MGVLFILLVLIFYICIIREFKIASMEKQLSEILKSHQTAPFLFVGSGFSRRYIQSPDWVTLLSNVSPFGNHYNSYASRIEGGGCPEVAALMASDVNKEFWARDKSGDEHFLKYKDDCNAPEKALKFKIVDYLNSFRLSTSDITDSIKEELELIKDLPIDGVITTNWDYLLNELFPKYKVFIGQNGLLSARTSGIGEIYKIHGCLSEPESMVLTTNDYANYNSKNAFLAAKLMTIFVEHPVIFLGYSLSDENIKEIISNLSKCCDEHSIKMIEKNFIFVEWVNDSKMIPTIESSTIVLNDSSYFPVVKIKTHNYIPIYKCLKGFQRQIPTHLLRACKENFFNLIRTENPQHNIYVADWDEFEKGDLKNVQFVSGFGVIEKISEFGYIPIKINDLFEDFFIEEKQYNVELLLNGALKNMQGNTPIYKYISRIQKNKRAGLIANLKCTYWDKPKTEKQRNSILRCKERFKEVKLKDIVHEAPKIALYRIPYLNISEEELNELFVYLKKIYINNKNLVASTDFRKCVCYYDYLRYKKYFKAD